ncbi:hypothetical protein [Larkinella punicea]|uniref:Lipocalin-like domain-containing protein n=1 Tax=Larkinella punicea TaxID=2315727 RepID=A0A368JKN2_9BACT|nr:hypothetical protein [Larkinella punicea]RCR67224.1 hypothetical protein DUE52_23205 [Larkinella punicea]
MNTTFRLSPLLLLLGLAFFTHCKSKGSKTTPTPGIDLNKAWKTVEAKEGTTVVYKANATASIYPGYSRFRLVFEQSRVSLTEVTGETFSGNWTLEPEQKKLTLQALNPIPYGTNATINYTVVSWSPDQLVLLRNTENPKTGNTRNEYTLVPE